jgi:hypothetical protein
MAKEPIPSRQELMAPYRHPIRHSAIAAWRDQPELRRATLVGAGSFVVGAAGVAAGVALLRLLAGLGVMLGLIVALTWGVVILRGASRLTRSWRRASALGPVRARRPQAGTEDPELAHDEFAVTVEDDGHLITWRFRPLAIAEGPGEHEVEVPARPRYAALAIEHRRFDIQDAARAAEQLVEAQSRAAERETGAASAAHGVLDAATLSAELAVEARSTAAALQRMTGQRSRHD